MLNGKDVLLHVKGITCRPPLQYYSLIKIARTGRASPVIFLFALMYVSLKSIPLFVWVSRIE